MLVTFVIGPYRLCGPILPVRRMITPPRLTHVPLSKPTAAGVFLFEGRIALGFDLHHSFGLASRRNSGDGLLIVTDISAGVVAFWVDEVLDVSPATDFSWRTAPPLLEGGVAEQFASDSKQQLFLYVTYERLFREEANALIAAASVSAPVKAPDSVLVPVRVEQEKVQLIAQPELMPSIEVDTRNETALAAANNIKKSLLTAPVRAIRSAAAAVRPMLARKRATAMGSRFHAMNTQISEHRARAALLRDTMTQTTIRPELADYAATTIASEPAVEANFPQANARDTHRNLKPAIIIVLLPLLASFIYWAWPEQKNIKGIAERQATVVAQYSSPVPAPAATPAPEQTREPEPAQTARADQKMEVKAGDFVITVESPPKQTVAAPAAEKQSEQIIHTVRRGDTLWAISRRYLGNPYLYPEVARLSMIANPNLIHPGDIVRIRRVVRD